MNLNHIAKALTLGPCFQFINIILNLNGIIRLFSPSTNAYSCMHFLIKTIRSFHERKPSEGHFFILNWDGSASSVSLKLGFGEFPKNCGALIYNFPDFIKTFARSNGSCLGISDKDARKFVNFYFFWDESYFSWYKYSNISIIF